MERWGIQPSLAHSSGESGNSHKSPYCCRRLELCAELCPSHEGAAPCCTPASAAAQCFLFCESHFDCHLFAFISFPAPYMTHLHQDRGARAELGCWGAPFPASQPCFGQLSAKVSLGKEPCAGLQDLTCWVPIIWTRCHLTEQVCQGCPLPVPWDRDKKLLRL